MTAKRSRSLLTILSGAACAAAMLVPSQARAALVYEAKFDSATGSTINGVTNGSATLLNSASTTDVDPTIQNTTPLGSGGGGYLYAPGEANQGATLTPTASANSLAVLSSLVNGQRVLHGGMDLFLRTGAGVYATTTGTVHQGDNYLRIIDHGTATGTALRLIINNESSQEFKVNIFNNAAGSVSVSVPNNGTFQIAANTTYHMGVVWEYELDGNGVATGNSRAILFGIAGTGAIDTTDRTSSNPAYLATGSWTNFAFASESTSSGLPTTAYAFGKLNGRSNNQPQSFDGYRLYNSAPTSFAAIPEPASVGLFVAVGTIALRRRRV